MRTLSGSVEVPFSTLVQDTIDAHGFDWAFEFYCGKHKLSPLEFAVFSGSTYESVEC